MSIGMVTHEQMAQIFADIRDAMSGQLFAHGYAYPKSVASQERDSLICGPAATYNLLGSRGGFEG
jgi:hypothetical protein